MVLALLSLLGVRIQANTLTLVGVETNETCDFLLCRYVLRLDSTKLGDVVVDLDNFVEPFWVVLEQLLEQLDVPLNENALKLLEELGRLEGLTRNVKREVIG